LKAFTKGLWSQKPTRVATSEMSVYRSACRYPQIASGGETFNDGFRLCLTEDQADTEWFPAGE